MAIVVDNRVVVKENRSVRETISCHFSTTDANGTIPVQALQVITSFSIGIIGTPAADEVISVDEDAATINGKIIMQLDRLLTLKRTGAVKTSGLKFMLTLIGNN